LSATEALVDGGWVDESVGAERWIATLPLQRLIEYAMLLPYSHSSSGGAGGGRLLPKHYRVDVYVTIILSIYRSNWAAQNGLELLENAWRAAIVGLSLYRGLPTFASYGGVGR